MHCLQFPEDQRHPADFDESLLQMAADGTPVAAVWQAHQALVVPRTYRRFPAFDDACARSAARGWPVIVRQSGGGIVPQGGGILNFSLVRPQQGRPLDLSDALYLELCRVVSSALLPMGIDSHPGAVQGSFCDGRFNLAVDGSDGLRKIAGTAQLWRRIAPAAGGTPVQVVLAHAVILAQVDTDAITQHINAFEDDLGSGNRYLAQRIASLHTLIPPAADNTDAVSLTARVSQALLAATAGL